MLVDSLFSGNRVSEFWYVSQSSRQVSMIINFCNSKSLVNDILPRSNRRKYLKINPSLVATDQPGTPAYLNVLATSSKEPDALLYCTAQNTSKSLLIDDTKSCTALFNYSQELVNSVRNMIYLQSDICTAKVSRYYFEVLLTFSSYECLC